MAVKSLIHVIIKFVFFLTPKLLEVPPCAFAIQLDIKKHHHCSEEEGGNEDDAVLGKNFLRWWWHRKRN